jgi:hypothetical protein
MAVDDIVGVRIVGRYQSQNIVNTMHYKITAQDDTEHVILQLLAAEWETALKAYWLDLHNDAYSLMGLRAFSLSGENKRPGIVHIDDAGLLALIGAPSPLCRVITLYTDSTNYRRRGRIMLSGSNTTDFDEADGSVAAGVIGDLEALGLFLIEDLVSEGNTFSPGLAPHGILPFEPFTSVLGRKTPACIRSRRVRGFLIG